ncbi:hypothetical protein MAA_01394 [Metarhizium robertsii ARSEF 23]|nr:uncharacterized protein MAA_01394 [Metarhizium robertsii ARSEF 23]EFZ04320.2 hypothetical protein MAA_01394 [Metarhizium robertsii ARSEF 23]
MNWREDVLMGLATLLYATLAYYAIIGIVAGGIGKHMSDITLDELYLAFRSWLICELIYGPLSAIIRTSVALLLFRLPLSTYEKWALYTCLGMMYAFTIIYFFITLFQCNPPPYFWERFHNFEISGSCNDPHRLPIAAYWHSGIAGFSDLFITALSIWKLVQPRLKSKQDLKINSTRIVIIVFLSFGVLLTPLRAGVVMLVRIPYIRDMDLSPDFLYETVTFGGHNNREPSFRQTALVAPLSAPECKRHFKYDNQVERKAGRNKQNADRCDESRVPGWFSPHRAFWSKAAPTQTLLAVVQLASNCGSRFNYNARHERG